MQKKFLMFLVCIFLCSNDSMALDAKEDLCLGATTLLIVSLSIMFVAGMCANSVRWHMPYCIKGTNKVPVASYNCVSGEFVSVTPPLMNVSSWRSTDPKYCGSPNDQCRCDPKNDPVICVINGCSNPAENTSTLPVCGKGNPEYLPAYAAFWAGVALAAVAVVGFGVAGIMTLDNQNSLAVGKEPL